MKLGIKFIMYVSTTVLTCLYTDSAFYCIVPEILSFPLQLLAYDTVNKTLSPKPGEEPKLPIPASLVAGACAGVSSTLVTYPLELVKTRLTIQVNLIPI